MSSRSVHAPNDEGDREPRHSDLLAALRIGLAESEVRADERQKAVLQRLDAGDRRFQSIEEKVLKIATDQAEANGAAQGVEREMKRLAEKVEGLANPVALPAAAPAHDGGIPFKHGWRSWVVITGLTLAALAALKGALMALDWVGGGITAAWQYLTHH